MVIRSLGQRRAQKKTRHSPMGTVLVRGLLGVELCLPVEPENAPR